MTWFVEQPFLIPKEISSGASVPSSHKKPEGHYKVSCRTAVGKMADTGAEIQPRMRQKYTHVITRKKGEGEKREATEGGETESTERKERWKKYVFPLLILLFMVLFNDDVNKLDFADD